MGMSIETVVLDSNALFGDPWFKSAKSRLFVSRASIVARNISIPEVVIAEAIENLGRRVDASHSKLDKTFNELRRLAKGQTILNDWNIYESVRATYGRFLKDLTEKPNWEATPIPEVSHTLLVDRAIKRKRPFDDSGTGYRDSIVWFSLLDIVKRSGASTAALITNDRKAYGTADEGIFPDLQADLDSIRPGISVQIFPDISQFVSEVIEPNAQAIGQLVSVHDLVLGTGLTTQDFQRDLLIKLNEVIGPGKNTLETEWMLFDDQLDMFFADAVIAVRSIGINRIDSTDDRHAMMDCDLDTTIRFSTDIYSKYLDEISKDFQPISVERFPTEDGEIALIAVDHDVNIHATIAVSIEHNTVSIDSLRIED